MPFNFRSDDPTRELRRVWKGKYPLPQGQTQATYTPVEEKSGGSFIGAIYKKTPTKPGKPQTLEAGKKWLGKPGFSQRGFENSTETMQTRSLFRRGLDAIAEKIAGDAYHVANRGLYQVPKHRLAMAPVLHNFLPAGHQVLANAFLHEINKTRQVPLTQALHIFSKWVEGYQDLSTVKTRFQGQEVNFMECLITHQKVPESVLIEDREIPLVGLMDILAVSRLLGDTDVLGGGGGNAGIVVQRNPDGEPIVAVMVKIDPGFAFNFTGPENKFHQTQVAEALHRRRTVHMLNDLKDIQFGNNNQQEIIQWNRLSEIQKLDFLMSFEYAKGAFEEGTMIEMLLLRGGAFSYQGEALVRPETAHEIAAQWRENLYIQTEIYEAVKRTLKPQFENQRQTQEQIFRSWRLVLDDIRPQENQPRIVGQALLPERDQLRAEVLPQSIEAVEPFVNRIDVLAEAVQDAGFFQPAPRYLQKRFGTTYRVNQAEVNRLLLHVALGEQYEIESIMLRNYPELLLHKGNVTDYSNRTFNNITAFQYAVWALDWHMWKMLRKYLPNEAAKTQLQELENYGTEHGQNFDFVPLLQALTIYNDNLKSWNWIQLDEYWRFVIGGEQTQVPTHVANEYCRLDHSFSPTPSFREDALPRTLLLQGDITFFPCIEQRYGLLGRDFGVYRAHAPKAWSASGNGRISNNSFTETYPYIKQGSELPFTSESPCELTALSTLHNVRTSQLAELKRELDVVPAQRLEMRA